MAEEVGLLFLAGCSWMTLYAAFCWKSFWWSLLFCTIHFISHMELDSKFEPYNHKSLVAASTNFRILCTVLGVFMLLTGIGLSLFSIVFSIGVISTIGSIVFIFVEKKFDQTMHSAVSAARDALAQNKNVVEVLAAVLVAFICGLAAFLSPTPRRRIDINEREIITTEEERRELSQRLEKIIGGVTLFTVIGTIIVESGLIFWIIRAWYADAINFAGLFFLGAGCTIAGVWLRNMLAFGLTPFVVGNLCIMFSTLCLEGPSAQLDRMFDNTRESSAAWMIIGFVLTQLTIFWWDSFVLASLFCVLYIVSTAWYCLSYITLGRYFSLNL